MRSSPRLAAVVLVLVVPLGARSEDGPPRRASDRHWLWSTATAVPEATTSEQSGYFSIVEGKNGRLYVGTAKYGANAFLVEFDPLTRQMKVVVDAQKAIGTTATGFAARPRSIPATTSVPAAASTSGRSKAIPRREKSPTTIQAAIRWSSTPRAARRGFIPFPSPTRASSA